MRHRYSSRSSSRQSGALSCIDFRTGSSIFQVRKSTDVVVAVVELHQHPDVIRRAYRR
jgi:hypothetical protein